MSRKIKSANKVETGIRGCFFAVCVCVWFFSPLFSVSQHPVFPEKTPRGSRFSFDVKVNHVNARRFSFLHSTQLLASQLSVLPQSYMM